MFSESSVFPVHTKTIDLFFKVFTLESFLKDLFFVSINISVFNRFNVEGRQKRIQSMRFQQLCRRGLNLAKSPLKSHQKSTVSKTATYAVLPSQNRGNIFALSVAYLLLTLVEPDSWYTGMESLGDKPYCNWNALT